MQIVKLHNDRIVLVCGDCQDVLKRLKSESADLIIGDPPYRGVVKADWDHQWETQNDYLEWSQRWLLQSKRVLKQSGSLYLWGGIGERSDTIVHLYLLVKQMLYFKDWITWSKSRGMGTRRGWCYTREELLWFVKDNSQFIWNKEHQYSAERRKRDRGMPSGEIRVSQNGYKALSEFKRLTNVWNDISENTLDVINRPEHCTPKPPLAIERIIQAHTTSDQAVVVDPFMGSGTTGEACVKLDRKFIGIERDSHHFTYAVRRIENAITAQLKITSKS